MKIHQLCGRTTFRCRFPIDDANTYTDSIWWNWGGGNVVVYPSKFLPTYNVPGYRRWIEQGINIVSVFQQETRKRGLEGFYSLPMA